jgi:mannose-1-phosphate guanylyltransferase
MIQQTVARLLPLAPARKFWVITNRDSYREIVRQMGKLPKNQIIAEPVGRNTAPAIGLAAFILRERDPSAVIGLFPSDHVTGDEDRFRATLSSGIQIAAEPGNIVVLGIKPTRPETGYGYIEAGAPSAHGALRVRRFTEKPNAGLAAGFLQAGNYFWNSGMFLWSARTLADALNEHLPKTAGILERIAASFGTRRFATLFARLYPQCENISVDYAVLEPRSAKGEDTSRIYCLPADFSWNDLGSWAALHEHQAARRKPRDGNLIAAPRIYTLASEDNYIHAPGKFVAAVGVKDLVVVDTGDALLITTRAHSQDVGKVVKYLDEKKLKDLV